ncbi:hypothetical protein GCM10009755_24550 [Brevibacterium samyangense]|uniref:Glycosyl transferase n=1 Tax=Brevibacterium samyangense TaxID=366888 RepID=A0ABP5EYZ9_9MICO
MRVRYIFSVLFIVAGLVLGGLGVLQKTLWAPSENITASTTLEDPGPLLVVDPGVLNLYDTPAKLTIEGEGDLVMVEQSKEFVDAWVGDTTHTNITGLSGEGALAAERTDGEQATAPNPATGDTWNSVTTGEGTLELTWDEDPGRTTFLVASDGTQPAATDVTVEWPNHAETPWALPLIIGGAVLVVIGIVLAVTRWRRGRKDRARREARVERRKKLVETGAAFAVVPAIALAGCAPSPELPTPQPAAAPSTAPASVTDEQITKILEDTAKVVADADGKTDAKALEPRAAGAFATQRNLAYEVKKKSEDFTLPPAVADQEVLVNWTTQTDTWPRITSVVASDEEIGQTQYLVFSQEDVRAPYKLVAQTTLVPGVEFPSVADARAGALPVAGDSEDFVLKPQDITGRYADVLTHGDQSKFAGDFSVDALRLRLAGEQKNLTDSLASGNATVEFSYSADSNALVVQQTADGAAIVTGVVGGTTTMTPEKEDDRVGKLSLTSPISDIVGETETEQSVESTRQMQVTFFVPKADAAEDARAVELIGVTDTMSGAELK